MSNPIDLKASRSLELLSSLEHTAADFAKKEDQLLNDLRTRRYATTRKYGQAIEVKESKMAAQVAEIESTFDAQTGHVQSVYDRRRARLQRAHLVATRQLPVRIKEVRSGWLGELQMKKFRLEKKLAADLDAQAGFARKLDEQRARLLKLKRRAENYFSGFGTMKSMLRLRRSNEVETGEPRQLLTQLQSSLDAAEEQLREFRELPLPRLFSQMPLFAMILAVILIAGAVAYAMDFKTNSNALPVAGGVGAALFGVVLFLHAKGLGQGRPGAKGIAASLSQAARLHEACSPNSDASSDDAIRAELQEQFNIAVAGLEEQKTHADDVQRAFAEKATSKLDSQLPRVLANIDRIVPAKLANIAAARDAQLQQIQGEIGTQIDAHKASQSEELEALATDENTRWQEIEAEWKQAITPIFGGINAMNAATEPWFPAWSPSLVDGWEPPTSFTPATKFGHLDLDFTKHPERLPKDPRLALPGSPQVSIPLSLSFPLQGSLLFETSGPGDDVVFGTLNNIILRLLATTPPGKLSFTILDPVDLGQNFSGLMHLSDYEETLINRRIWTQRDQIEERLAEMSEHIEKVIQMYLRNEYATITEYNEKAGSVAEKYHFLVVADFPANFSETAAKRLQSIATSGARCGIFTLIHWDQRQPLPDGFVADELRQNSICLHRDRDRFVLSKEQAQGKSTIVFDPPPNPDLAVALVHKIGRSSIDSNRVQVPFAQIAPKPEEFWTNETTNELRIPVGRTGATKLQYLAIGKGTRQHALFAGKTGSGKSTLFHVIITNLALSCSPDQVEFYLIDFKKGVEFKCYASKHLPHAKVVAIESDREFALSVLQRVDGELKRRGDMFRKLGVQDIAGYKRAGGTEPMPRSLLLIDEFQEFFVDDDTIAQTASLLFDRIVRQGRAFGIHVLLGSQTLGGAYSLARATLGQMVIRVALQCNEADAYLIMDENNPAPRLLTRPGEGIYNDSAGAMEGNSPFQVVWLPDDERDQWLDKVNALNAKRPGKHSSPIVFEGNAPADIRENDPLRFALDERPTSAPPAAHCWLGAPNSIKGPTEVVFNRQSGNHLLIVGQRDEAALTMLGVSMLALAAQYPVGKAMFVLIHASNPGSPDAEFLDEIVKAIPHEVRTSRGADIGEIMSEISTGMKARTADEGYSVTAPSVFLIVHGLHKFKKLRQEDDFSFSMSDDAGGNPGTQFTELISEGSSQGMHVITTVDTFNNVNRCMNRKALSEFEMRVVFQMSANDSASLIDSPKASNLGLHRALFYSEHEGTLETFRPYATPNSEWIHEAAAKLAST